MCWCFYIVLLILGERSVASLQAKSRQNLIDELFRGYDPRILPNVKNDGPVEVVVQLLVNTIDKISETEMEYSLGMFLRQSWYDERLEFEAQPGMHSLELDVKLMDSIWVPDLFIANEKKGEFHTITVPNKLMHIYPGGRIQYSMRVSEVLKCNMDLRKFPLDTQYCDIVLESYGYSTANLVFKWHEDGVQIAEGLKVPQYALGDVLRGRCDKQYIGVNYTCVRVEFELIRSFGYYITQVYLPSIMIVILSFVSFWLDIDAVPARISLGLLTVLTMTTQSASARSSLPRVSYVKGIDIWMAMCLLFVFSALLEFAYINVLARVARRRNNVQTGLRTFISKGKDEEEAAPGTPESRKRKFRFLSNDREKARNCDRISRIVFPLALFIFNLIYWCVYLLWVPQDKV